jgi:hypothetical protein
MWCEGSVTLYRQVAKKVATQLHKREKGHKTWSGPMGKVNGERSYSGTHYLSQRRETEAREYAALSEPLRTKFDLPAHRGKLRCTDQRANRTV